MRTRVFPDGTEVSAVGAGDVSLARAALRNVDAGSVAAALEMALGLGITFVDVADEEDAERLVGVTVRALRVRDRVTVSTRIPIETDPFGMQKLGVPIAWVQERVEKSLRATRFDALPLAQISMIPGWASATEWAELVETCARLVREGKVMRWSAVAAGEVIVPRDPEEPLPPSALDAPWLVAIALPFSMCERKSVRPPEKITLGHRPLAGGALAGALGPGAKLAIKDDRHAVDEAMLTRYAMMASRLAPYVKREPPSARSCVESRAYLEQGKRPERVECETLAELALRWAIDRGVLALPRLHRKEHVAEAVGAGMAAPLLYDPVS